MQERVFAEQPLARFIHRHQAHLLGELASALERGRRGAHQHLAGCGVEGDVLEPPGVGHEIDASHARKRRREPADDEIIVAFG